jgi:hypothetical protein
MRRRRTLTAEPPAGTELITKRSVTWPSGSGRAMADDGMVNVGQLVRERHTGEGSSWRIPGATLAFTQGLNTAFSSRCKAVFLGFGGGQPGG